MPEPVSLESARTVGQRVAYASLTLLRAREFEAYADVMRGVLAEDVHYIDAVHELHDRDAVLEMLGKYLPRVANEAFEFELLVDAPEQALWRWTMSLLIMKRWTFVIHGLVHAQIKDGRIVYQREYYDPMESIGVIPLVGRLYKRLLQMG